MRVLVACEYSGVVRDSFIAYGHDAMSCDYMESERLGPHIVGDVSSLLRLEWDLVIAHPPCTYLCNSGVTWLWNRDGTRNNDRWKRMRKAREFFMACLNSNSPKVAVENPVAHGYANLGPPSFTVQPWEFGHGETKRTCFWTRGLPALRPTEIVEGRYDRLHRLGPSETRAKERSRTYPGIALAMAEQWGSLAR